MANSVLRSTDLTIDGNLVVTGTTTAVESTNTTITDNIIVLNQDEVGAGVTLGTAGIEIDRGTEDNAQLIWDEPTDTWQMKVGSTVTGTISSGLPSQTTHAGKFLTTDGTTASWVDESTINTSHTKKALIYAIIFGG